MSDGTKKNKTYIVSMDFTSHVGCCIDAFIDIRFSNILGNIINCLFIENGDFLYVTIHMGWWVRQRWGGRTTAVGQ